MSDVPVIPASSAEPVSSDASPIAGDAPPAEASGISKQLAPKEPAVETPAQAAKRKYKQKVDGQEFEEELDDNEITARLQKGRAAEKRMQEAAQARKAFAEATEAWKKDPWTASKDLGIDLEALAEERVAEKWRKKLEEGRLSPEEKAKRDYESQLQAAKQEAEQARKELSAKLEAEMDAKVFEETQSKFLSALQAEGVPKSYEAMKEMARLAKLNLKHGLDLTEAQLAAEVRNSLNGEKEKFHKGHLNVLDGDALLSHLGDPIVKKVVKAALAKMKAPVAQKPPEAPKAPTESAPQKKQGKPMSSTQFLRKNLFGL